MTVTVWPIAAVAGSPAYSGRMLRQAQSVFLAGATSARPLGATSGVRPGTSTTTCSATSTTWTIGPHAGVMDVEVAAECGAYTYANDAAITGAMTAAHATLARVDILWMRVDDPPEDGTAVPAVVGGYTAGAAASTPAPPATPARCMVLGWVNVPASGGGAPTVTWVAPYMVAAGGAGAPTTYTPTLIATTTNPTNYVGTGRYIQVGKQVTFWFNITMSAGFTAGGGTYNISLPVTKANASNLSISGAGCMLYDSSASLPNYGVSPTVGSAGNVNYAAFQCLAAGILAAVTSAAPWVWAPNDQISGCLIYEGV